jgi:ribonuclease Y
MEVVPISLTIFAYIVTALLSAVIGAGVYEIIRRRSALGRRNQAEEQARQIVQGAQREAETLIKEAKLEAKDLVFQAKTELETEQKAKLAELAGIEKRIVQREENLDKKLTVLEKRESEAAKREHDLSRREEGLVQKEALCAQAMKEHREALERTASMTAEEAKRQLVLEMESQARLEAAGIAKRTLEEAKENAEREARDIIARSIQRVTRDYVNEATISVVPIPNDAMKGRIIGREGRNIRAIEAATGIDLIIDETPEAVIISGFDPLRREIAKVSLERLMHDGRIHPTRIEEIVEKVKTDIDKLMIEEAEKIIF